MERWRHGRRTLLLLAFAHRLRLALAGGGSLFLRHSVLYDRTCQMTRIIQGKPRATLLEADRGKCRRN